MENIIEPLFNIALYPFTSQTYFVLAPAALAFVLGIVCFVGHFLRRLADA